MVVTVTETVPEPEGTTTVSVVAAVTSTEVPKGSDQWFVPGNEIWIAIHCATPGKDAFLGRGINSIVVDQL